MDALFARWSRYGLVLALLSIGLIASVGSSDAEAADFRTRNFIIEAPTQGLAKAVGEAAEKYRDDLAQYWTGQTLPPWPRPCPVRVVAGPNLAAQGVTTYNPAPVRDFQMEVIGTPERILDSVLPHEVTHTVLATYFGRPLPRWADEGICTTVEHVSERSKHEAKLREFLSSRRGIAMNQLFLLTEYPPDVLPMYAQGYSVCRFLIEQQGPRTFIAFLKDYMRRPSWTANVQKHYSYDSLAELQQYWLSWVESGSGPVTQFVKADVRPENIASRSSGSSTGTSRVAPATALAAADLQARNNDINSLVAANDRGRVSEQSSGDSWYHRRANGEAGTAIDSLAAAPASLATTTPTEPKPISPWAPPSVLSSGRYSAATPQGESRGSQSTWR